MTHKKALSALIITVLLWGTSFVAIRQSMHDFSPGSLALLRYIIAAIAVIPVYFLLQKRTKPNLKDLPVLFVLGMLGIGIYNILLNIGEVTTSAAIASFMISQGPVATIILAVIFLHERLTTLSWLGMVLSVCGIVLISHGETQALGHFNYGIFYLVAAIGCAALYSILQKPLLKRFHPLEITAWSIWFGTLTLAFYIPNLWHEVQHQTLANYGWPAFLGVGSGVIGYACLAYGFKHFPASKAISFLFAMPFVSIIMGWLVLGEIPTTLSLLGGLLAMSGAFMVRTKKPALPGPID
ncbi:MAG: DMT family transporter [Pseudomonadota bacterium]